MSKPIEDWRKIEEECVHCYDDVDVKELLDDWEADRARLVKKNNDLREILRQWELKDLAE